MRAFVLVLLCAMMVSGANSADKPTHHGANGFVNPYMEEAHPGLWSFIRARLFSGEWASWVIEWSDFTTWFGGDTGYNTVQFAQIGEAFPSIDLGIIPIGAHWEGVARPQMSPASNTNGGKRLHHGVSSGADQHGLERPNMSHQQVRD